MDGGWGEVSMYIWTFCLAFSDWLSRLVSNMGLFSIISPQMFTK